MHSYIFDNARFTVICDGALRMEYSKDGAFVDEPTLFAERNSFFDADFSLEDGILYIKTDKFTLTYKGGEFSPHTLFARIHTAGVDTLWHFGDAPLNNLGGTLHTLDGVNGHKPLPDGIVSRDGFYVFSDSGKPVIKDGWAADRPDSHICDLYLFAYGHDYKAAICQLRAVSGDFPLPRRCVFGSWYSRWWRYTADEFLDLVKQYDDNGFPLDIMVMDMDWHYQDWGHSEGEPYALYGYGHCGGNLGWTGYTWNRTAIPDPEGLIDTLHKKGIRVVLNDHPADGLRDHEEHYESFMAALEEKGYTESVPDVCDRISERERENTDRNVKNFRFNAGSPVYMEAFFDHALAPIEKAGVEFWWLDWQQDYLYPTVNGVKDLPHLPWLNRLYYEHSRKGGKRGASFSRWGGIGDHKHPAYFSGDSMSGWETLSFEVEMTATAANAGCFWWSHDIGGFCDPIPGGQSENYVRWVQFGALSASLRLHMNGVEGFDRRPWTWGEPYCSAMREAFLLRSRLFPYIYSSAYESATEALPFIRPLYYESPNDEEAYKHPTTYLLGKNLIVSPICEEGKDGVAKKELWLPEGDWFNFFDEKPYSGKVQVTCDLNSFPLFVRANTPFVTRGETMRMTDSPYDELFVHVYCSSAGKGEALLYEDDGTTEDYKIGKCRKTVISYFDDGSECELSLAAQGFFEGMTKARRLSFILHSTKRREVYSANAEYETALCGDTLTVTLPECDASGDVKIILR
ncbi:MAG: DUF5110 domain-containing protein [Clostridia bacterium]|nr:DUF5110 domain-containing protein [Clostridia bacterium]